jgi:hypothetical protein
MGGDVTTGKKHRFLKNKGLFWVRTWPGVAHHDEQIVIMEKILQ